MLAIWGLLKMGRPKAQSKCRGSGRKHRDQISPGFYYTGDEKRWKHFELRLVGSGVGTGGG